MKNIFIHREQPSPDLLGQFEAGTDFFIQLRTALSRFNRDLHYLRIEDNY